MLAGAVPSGSNNYAILKKKHNVLLIDLRGHGKSKNKIYEQLRSYTFDVISNEVIEVLDHLKVKKLTL